MQVLPTNIATKITVGPFVDYETGVDPEIALTVTNTTCTMKVSKDDGSAVVRTAITLSASGGNNDMVHITDDTEGYYDLELTGAQLNFLGRMELSFMDVDVHLPIWKEYMVVPLAVYQAMVLGTGTLQADMIKIAAHSIIGTDTRVADAFEAMFNVASPQLTVASKNQTGDSYAEVVKIPHSDGVVTFNATALADIKAQADLSLDSATPAKPTTDSLNERIIALDSLISASKIAASMDAMSDIDFSAKMKVSLNASTPISVGKVTGNVDGSVKSVTDNVNAQVKGMDADTLTASALKADAVTEIVDAMELAGVSGGGKWVNEGETSIGNIYLKNATQIDKYLGLYLDTDEPPETATLATITEVAIAFGYARIKLENSQWTEDTSDKGLFVNLVKTFTATGGNISSVTGYFICTAASGTSGNLLTVEHFSDAVTILNGQSLQITPRIRIQ